MASVWVVTEWIQDPEGETPRVNSVWTDETMAAFITNRRNSERQGAYDPRYEYDEVVLDKMDGRI